MKLLTEIIESIPDSSVNEVVIGERIALVNSAEGAGIANRISYDAQKNVFVDNDQFQKMSLKELAMYSLSDNLFKASIGMAAINCGLGRKIGKYKTVNAKEIILEKGRNKVLGIIGHFPFLDDEKDNFTTCYIFEKSPKIGDLKESDIPHYLPKADVVAITGTTVTNHTFEGICNSLPTKSYNIMLGPSTPLSPLLFDHGMDMISGTYIRDYKLVKKHVLNGGSTRYLKGAEMISLFKEDYR